MNLTIYDVAHGFCARLVTPNNKTVFFDCGFDSESTPNPVADLGIARPALVERLYLSNYDQDHIRGIIVLRRACTISSLNSNPTLSVATLRQLKEQSGDITDAMESVLEMKASYSGGVVVPDDWGGLRVTQFYNSYPDFQDTNNLSMVTLVEDGTNGILFTGDIEVAGWEALLLRSDFQAALRRVTIFVASHHGRESGYCPAVFNYCAPRIIIISDKEIVHDTQHVDYTRHAAGVIWPDRTTRYVLTTRNDGPVFISRNVHGGWYITKGQ